MARDWRWVCTTKRLHISILIALGSLFFFFLVSIWIEDHQFNELARRRELLKVGMTEQELFQIMGKPVFSQLRNVGELAPTGFPPKDIPEEVRKKHQRILVYGFISKKTPWSRSAFFAGGIYLDENHKGIVMVDSSLIGVMDFFDLPTVVRFAFLVCLIVAVLIPVVGFQLWCKKKLKNLPARNPGSTS